MDCDHVQSGEYFLHFLAEPVAAEKYKQMITDMKNNNDDKQRVRKNTPDKYNEEIDAMTLDNIKKYSVTPEVITYRLKKLDKEWGIERWLELNMSVISLIGITLALTVSPYWIILTCIVLLFFIQHAVQGWCPPLPIFRANKVRTRAEIDKEKYALKAIRGDFKGMSTSPEEAFRLVNKE